MLALETTRLDELLVRLLATSPNLSAAELQKRAGEVRGCSIQGVYHELRKLQAAGVVLKVRESYSLSLTWAFEFVKLADSVYDNYIVSASRSEILPEPNSSKSWKFTNLLRLDDFWVQAMVLVFKHTNAKHLYNWIPHPWYYFAQMSKVSHFYALFESEGWQYHTTIGDETYLDRRYAEGMPKSFFEYRLGEAPVFSDMSRYVTIIGDYMMSVKLDRETAARVNGLFDSIKSAEELMFGEVLSLLNAPGNLTFKIEHSPTKVGGYTRKYQRYFGG